MRAACIIALSTLAAATASSAMTDTPPTAAAAAKFVNDAEAKLAAVNVEQQRASWVAENFITYDTQLIGAAANEKPTALGVELAKQAARFDSVPCLSYDTRRKLDLIKLALTTPGPSDAAATAEMARIGAEMDALYGAGKYKDRDGKTVDINETTRIMRSSRDPQQLLEAWAGWHTIARPMKQDYARFVELTNEGARELGYKDAGAM